MTVEDPAPSGVFFRQAHPSQGHCTINRELRCALGTIPAGGQALVQVTATIAADASGPIVNHASVWSNQGDPNESNDTARQHRARRAAPGGAGGRSLCLTSSSQSTLTRARRDKGSGCATRSRSPTKAPTRPPACG